eukprot:superscaffoldBa00000995_g8414
MPGVVDVRFAEREPAEKRSLLSWEQKNTCILPEDLRDFYLTTDGFTLTWSVKLDDECVPLGCMVINSVARLCPLLQPVSLFSLPNAPSLADLDWEENSAECATFTSYYRLMITHLGLPEWQYSFTPYGPSPQAKQWASLYQPLTYRSELSLADPAGDSHLNKLDPTRAFKGKVKVPAPKKKQSAPCNSGNTAKSQGSTGRHSGTKR